MYHCSCMEAQNITLKETENDTEELWPNKKILFIILFPLHS